MRARGVRAAAFRPGFVAGDRAAALADRPATRLTEPRDPARIVASIPDPPNQARVAEVAVNCQLEESF